MPHNGHDGPSSTWSRRGAVRQEHFRTTPKREAGISGDAPPTHPYDNVKLHRRTLLLDGRRYTVLGLRPAAAERFAVNHFHGTWHIVTHTAGSHLLAALLWGLSYQRTPDTILVVDRPFLDANPFDAQPSPPIVVVPVQTTPFGDGAARDLRRKLPLGPSEGTVRLHAHGLAAALTDSRAWFAARPPQNYHGYDQRHMRPVIRQRAGLLVLPGTADWLREWAVQIGGLNAEAHRGPYAPRGMDYDDIHEDFSLEVQVFADYRARVTAARLAREQLPDEVRTGQDETGQTAEVWSRGTEIRAHMRRSTAARRRRTAKSGSAAPS
ncbi:hypothetical protein [Yinghuangia soli]|uniref:Uncharacterized protein n=1 Tax=Yinghuangia soli TaxID=2908204 RepID=A0AA41TY59_9ACTN|nr:hypothetical protein [Yinghuangia soli]MCF2527503.1 hypothetical protein [Yinghuangia soli]